MKNKKVLVSGLVLALGLSVGGAYFASNNSDLQGNFKNIMGPPPCDPALEECEELLPPLEECDPEISPCDEKKDKKEGSDNKKEDDKGDKKEEGEDADMDGLFDYDEGVIGTDSANPDTDGDGLLDGEEVLVHHINPLDPDTDGGGSKDKDELDKGTDPKDHSDD